MIVLLFQNPPCDCMMAITEHALSQKGQSKLFATDNATFQQLEAKRMYETKRPCEEESI